MMSAETAAEVLRRDEIETFRRDGFVFVPGFYGAAEIKNILRFTEEVSALPEAPGKHFVYYEDSLKEPGTRVVQRIEYFTQHHSGFAKLFNEGRMQQAAGELLGEPAQLFKEKINYKLPGGQGFKAHQDAQAGWNVYASFYVTALVSIDEATIENGCLEVAAGWHDRGLVGNEWTPLDDKAMAGMKFAAYPTKPGDAMFFDSYAPHRSGPNMTSQPRRVLYVTYNRASEGDHRERYFTDKRKSFPPDIERKPGETYVFRV